MVFNMKTGCSVLFFLTQIIITEAVLQAAVPQ